MNSSRYHKQQLKYLASILHIDTEKLKYAIEHSQELYKEWEEIKRNKRTGEIKYKSGKPATRKLKMAVEPLYEVQAKIKTHILFTQEFPDCVHGCIKGRSNITNAKKHQGKKYKFTTDLLNYYDTLNAEKVYYCFIRMGYSQIVSTWLTLLTTKNNAIPQGASTSNLLQNLIFRATDNFLQALCKDLGITYTRYVDDLTFSSPKCFKEHIPEIIFRILTSGCKINNRKTKYGANAVITGIKVLNNYIDISEELKEIVRLEKVNGIKGPYCQYLDRIINTNTKSKILLYKPCKEN
jgi:RNA-directed DNA polymerase